MDLFKLFKDYEGKISYDGGGNFVKGKKECHHCKSNMIRKPVKQPYIDLGDSFLLVDASPSTGVLKVSNVEPEHAWFCESCAFAVSSVKPRPIIPVIEE